MQTNTQIQQDDLLTIDPSAYFEVEKKQLKYTVDRTEDQNGNVYFEDEYVNQSSCNHDAGWRRVNDLRDKYGDSVEFDRLLSQSMTIYLPENKRYDDVFPTVNDAWNSFEPIFTVMHGLFLFRPFHEIYADESMRLLREDNVQYVELRADLVDFWLAGLEAAALQRLQK